MERRHLFMWIMCQIGVLMIAFGTPLCALGMWIMFYVLIMLVYEMWYEHIVVNHKV